MKRLAKWPSLLSVLALAGSLSACDPGEGLAPDFEEQSRRSRVVIAGQGDDPNGQKPDLNDPNDPNHPGSTAPVETYLDGQLRLPVRLKAQTLTVTFRSNLDGVAYECAILASRDFLPCPAGDSYDFGRLVHGRAYQIKVRAVDAASGRADVTPLTVAFVADLETGLLPLAPVTMRATVPAGAAELPSQAEPRLLQVGSFYGVNAAPGYLVTSYATTKTTNSAIRSMRLTGRSDLSQVFDARPCDPALERERMGPDGLRYCESTPTTSEWENDFGTVMPQNHLEIVKDSVVGRPGQAGADEKLFVAAFDGEVDQAGGRLGIGDTCRSATSSGETEVPIVYGFYDAMPERVPFTWCQVRDRGGRHWWIGAFTVTFAAGGDIIDPTVRPHLRVIYTASAELGLFSGSQFATRAGEFIAPVLVPLVPIARDANP